MNARLWKNRVPKLDFVEPKIIKAYLVWWPKMQRLNCPEISEAMRTTNAALETFLNSGKYNKLQAFGKSEIWKYVGERTSISSWHTEVYVWHTIHGQNHKCWRMDYEHSFREHALSKCLVHRLVKNRTWDVSWNILRGYKSIIQLPFRRWTESCNV